MLVEMTREHPPVLADELVAMLAPAPGETAVDATFGAGGHARLVAERLSPGEVVPLVEELNGLIASQESSIARARARAEA